MLYEFKWKKPAPERKITQKDVKCSYKDPTADKAIANVMREQERKKKRTTRSVSYRKE